jgi:hypothetical protein
MIESIVKHQTGSNSKGHKAIGSAVFRIKIGINALKVLGNEVTVKRTPDGYVISKYGLDSVGRASIITISGNLTIPNHLIEEFESLGDYEIYLCYETESAFLIKL